MPKRNQPFINNNYYHIYNHSIDEKNIFISIRDNQLFFDLIKYYRSINSQISFSQLNRLSSKIKESYINDINKSGSYRIELICFCLMPSYFHFIIKQKLNNGISTFMANLINAFTKNYNKRNHRIGPIFLPKFKSVKINTEEELLNISRYIHLSPYSNGMIKNIRILKNYRYSSFPVYTEKIKDDLVNPKPILKYFNFNKKEYKKFVINNIKD